MENVTVTGKRKGNLIKKAGFIAAAVLCGACISGWVFFQKPAQPSGKPLASVGYDVTRSSMNAGIHKAVQMEDARQATEVVIKENNLTGEASMASWSAAYEKAEKVPSLSFARELRRAYPAVCAKEKIDIAKADLSYDSVKAAEDAVNLLGENHPYVETCTEQLSEVKAEYRDYVNDHPSTSGSFGSKGRLLIPDAGVSVALNVAGDYDVAQAYCDRADSAAYMTYWTSIPAIGDHNYQGFSNIENSQVGYTKAYIMYGDGSYDTFICSDAYKGYAINDGEDIQNKRDGNYILNHYSSGLIMYTCSPHWPNVYVTYWTRVD